MFNDSKETAAFNLALQYLNRINNILNNNYTKFKNGDMRGFAINLRQLYRELIPWLLVDQKRGIDQTEPFKKEFEKLSSIKSKSKDEIWNQMEKIEDMIRCDFKQLGMLMPKMNDPRFLFGNKQK